MAYQSGPPASPESKTGRMCGCWSPAAGWISGTNSAPALDAQIVRRASRAMWGPLLRSGVRIYEFQPTMYHTNVMVVDAVELGGVHQLRRPLVRLNDEANLNVLDAAFDA